MYVKNLFRYDFYHFTSISFYSHCEPMHLQLNVYSTRTYLFAATLFGRAIPTNMRTPPDVRWLPGLANLLHQHPCSNCKIYPCLNGTLLLRYTSISQTVCFKISVVTFKLITLDKTVRVYLLFNFVLFWSEVNRIYKTNTCKNCIPFKLLKKSHATVPVLLINTN